VGCSKLNFCTGKSLSSNPKKLLERLSPSPDTVCLLSYREARVIILPYWSACSQGDPSISTRTVRRRSWPATYQPLIRRARGERRVGARSAPRDKWWPCRSWTTRLPFPLIRTSSLAPCSCARNQADLPFSFPRSRGQERASARGIAWFTCNLDNLHNLHW
jgi:hypothetical protein